MPSRIRAIDFATLAVADFSFGVDYVLIGKGRRLEQITPLTVPASAAGLFGLKFGPEGDAMRINGQGQPINVAGEDSVDGVWLVWMGTSLSPPTGVIEFAMSFAGTPS